MLFLCSSFDFKAYPPRPLWSLLYDDRKGAMEEYPGYLKGTGITLYDVQQSHNRLRDRIVNERICIVDAKAHFDGLAINPRRVCEMSPRVHCGFTGELELVRRKLTTIIEAIRRQEVNTWRLLCGEAARVYSQLQVPILRNGYAKIMPRYHLDTVSGRSRMTGFSIHNAVAEDDLSPMKDDFQFFVHFDWVAADLRIIAFLSRDEEMIKAFKENDPYTHVAKMLKVPRDEVKKAMFRAIYSLSVDEPVLECFPTMKKWFQSKIKEVRNNGYSESILGRRFIMKEPDQLRTVFNAAIQGSVAHAMQAVLMKVNHRWPGRIFTELQDALILAVSKDELVDIIFDVQQIMNDPFGEMMDESILFPLVISIGRRWRKWKPYRDVR